MDLPQPPADVDLKNIIDKLAQFVARNGLEFEQMTKKKQKDNPKFSFLFGGELFNYYQYKVTTEQAILKIKSSGGQGGHNTGNPPPLPSGSQEQFGDKGTTAPQTMTPMQIINAAANSTQWLPQQPQPQAHNTSVSLTSLVEQQNVLRLQITQSEQNLVAQHTALMQTQTGLIDEAIRKFHIERLNQKAIEAGINLNEFDSVLQPIIDSCTKDSISTGKAWILSHSGKGSPDVIAVHLLHKALSPGAQFTKKLHIIYLVNDVMHHCVRKNATVLKNALESVVVPMFCSSWLIGSSEQQEKLTKLLNLWEAKHTYFSLDVISKMKSPETSWNKYKEMLIEDNDEVVAPVKISTESTFQNYRHQHDLFVNHAMIQIQTLENEKIQLERQQQEQNQLMQIQNLQSQQPVLPDDRMPFANPPPNVLPSGTPFIPPPPDFSHLPPELLPDFSRPPPGFQPEPPVEDIIPTVPYYELPAGLMVTLVKIDDFDYKPLDPQKLRLPPAVPPSERLMQAVEAFYQKSYNGNPRGERMILDADGWEKLGLYEYYRDKNSAKKKKESDIESGLRQKSKSPSPIRRERSRSKSPKKKRVYKSKSPSPGKNDKKKSRSRSKSPPKRSNGRKSPRKSRPSRRSRSRSRSMSPPPRQRSATPPSFVGGFGKIPEEKLDESNKGHQMLKKMGWLGAGLGSNEQGIADPISGGDVRDRVDQYKGVGVSLHDPYESFRKNKGQAFITRMKARAEERAGIDPQD